MKIFEFDLDGTILHGNSIPDELITTLSKLNERHFLSFATSRSFRGVRSVVPETLLRESLQIVCNGAIAIFQGKNLFEAAISFPEVEDIQSFLESRKINYYLELGKSYFAPDYVSHPFLEQLKKEAPDEMVSEGLVPEKHTVYKIAVLDRQNNELLHYLEKKYSLTLHYYQHADKTVDIINCNASKWAALSHVAHSLFQNDWQVISFGNDSNDYEILGKATLGVIMNPELENQNHPDLVIIQDIHTLNRLLNQLI